MTSMARLGLVIAAGLLFNVGCGDAQTCDAEWTLLADPLDGTRQLAHQKRSAWVLLVALLAVQGLSALGWAWRTGGACAPGSPEPPATSAAEWIGAAQLVLAVWIWAAARPGSSPATPPEPSG